MSTSDTTTTGADADVWVGQYCINVTDLNASVRFYETLGLTNTSRTEIPRAFEAIMADAHGVGGTMQLAQQKDQEGPIDHGNSFWKLYVNTNDIDRQYADAMAAGYESVSPPERAERWPVTIAFLRDPDGYLVELVQRHPWPDIESNAWVGQYCIYVSDIDASIRFWETAGLTLTSRTEIPTAHEAILEASDGKGGKIQLAQKIDDDAPIDMGSATWKLYLHVIDCDEVHARMLDAGYRERVAPHFLERWGVTMSFVLDPDGYQVELVATRGR